MDMLFRLVSFQFQQEPQTQPQPQQYHHQQQHQSYDDDNNNHYYYKNNNSSNSSSSRSSKQTHHYYYQNPHYYHHHQDEESFNFLMDDEDFSSSSSHTNKQQHHHHYPYYAQSTTPPTRYGGGGGGALFESSSSATANFSYTPARDLSLELFSSSSSSSSFPGPTKWASELLLETARAVSDRNTERLHQLHWMLNEVGSPYGDVEQKLACYFSQALFARMTDSGDRCSRTMRAAVDKSTSFDSTRKMVLKFQEVSPWTTFGHVACNGALIDAFEGEAKVHIIDFSSTFCTQWPTLLEAVATRMDEPPKLTITTVVVNKSAENEGGGSRRVMREIGTRLEKFARLMGVPFKFNVVYHTGDFSELDLTRLDINDDEALAINCVNSLHSVNVNRRDDVVSMFRRLNPRVVTVVEEEAGLVDLGSDGFGFGFEFGECLRWFRVYFEALEESFSRTSNEKLMLERAAGRALLDLLACPEGDSSERRELAGRWSARMTSAGFCHMAFSDEVCDDVRALLRRYKEGWAMAQGSGDTSAAGIFLSWRDEPVVWASAWKP